VCGRIHTLPISICDVGPRDGLQNDTVTLAPEVRAELCAKLAATGLARVEAASFVNPARVPQMAGAEEVFAQLPQSTTTFAALVLNRKGLDRALAAGAKEIVEASPVKTTVTLAAAFGCPFEGRVDPGVVLDHAARMAKADEVILADTIGVGVPSQVRHLVPAALENGTPVGLHLHNTRNTGYANALAGIEHGATILDASVGGLGGCPFAPNATGNIATEDLLYLLENEGIETGVDVDALMQVSEWLSGVLGHSLPGLLHRAGNFPA
jgi:isopropylmalate/homocitrate/citramalate synthase